MDVCLFCSERGKLDFDQHFASILTIVHLSEKIELFAWRHLFRLDRRDDHFLKTLLKGKILRSGE